MATESKAFDVSAWMRAAEGGDAETIESLLAAGADVDARTHGGETALMRAAAKGRTDAVKLLLERGADPDARRPDLWTGLMLAAFFGHTDSVCALVCGGADVTASDRNGSTAHNWAASRGNVEAARFLKDAESVAETYKRKRAAERIAAEPKGDVLPSHQSDKRPSQWSPEKVSTPKPVEKNPASHVARPHLPAALDRAGEVAPRDGAHAFAAHNPPAQSVFVFAAPETTAAPSEVPKAAGEPARVVKMRNGGPRLRRAVIFAAPVLALACGVAIYKFAGAGARKANGGAQTPPSPEAQGAAQTAPPQTQAVPVSPIQPAPTSETITQSVAPAPATEFQPPAAYVPPPGMIETMPNSAAERSAGRAASAGVQTSAPTGAAAGGEPTVVQLGQPSAGDTERSAERQTPRGAVSPQRNSASETRDSEEQSSQSLRPTEQNPSTPRPTPTPKRKVIQWP